ICIRQIKTSTTFFIERIDPHVHQKQIQQTVVVEVEEDAAGGVANVAKAGLFCHILESALAEIFEKDIAHFHRRHKKVVQAIVVNIRKRSRDADSVFQSNSGLCCDIFEFPVA